MGITNENFPNEREEDPKCATNPLAENHTEFGNDNGNNDGNGPADIVAFAGFMRFLDQPVPACGANGHPACSPSINNGRNLFNAIGCATCHTPSLTTGYSPIAALNQKQVRLFSDLLAGRLPSVKIPCPRFGDGRTIRRVLVDRHDLDAFIEQSKEINAA